MDPVSCVSCVSWMGWLYAAETHETFHQESGMRYQHSFRARFVRRIGPFRCLPEALLASSLAVVAYTPPQTVLKNSHLRTSPFPNTSCW